MSFLSLYIVNDSIKKARDAAFIRMRTRAPFVINYYARARLSNCAHIIYSSIYNHETQ